MSLHALFCPGILETNSLVEYEMSLLVCVRVKHEIAYPLELQVIAWSFLTYIVLNVTGIKDLKTVRIEQFMEVSLVCRRIFYGEQSVIYPNFCLQATVGTYPV